MFYFNIFTILICYHIDKIFCQGSQLVFLAGNSNIFTKCDYFFISDISVFYSHLVRLK